MDRNGSQATEERRIYNRAWYAKNTESVKVRTKASNKAKRASIRDMLAGMKNVPCVDCGKEYPSYVMDFDHVRGEKKFNISSAHRDAIAMDRILEELKKCEVVCSNCHRIRTFTRSGLLEVEV